MGTVFYPSTNVHVPLLLNLLNFCEKVIKCLASLTFDCYLNWFNKFINSRALMLDPLFSLV